MRIEMFSPRPNLDAFVLEDAPGLMIITGVNGVGKSQLLQAMVAGEVKFSGLDPDKFATPFVLLTNADPAPLGLTEAISTDINKALREPLRTHDSKQWSFALEEDLDNVGSELQRLLYRHGFEGSFHPDFPPRALLLPNQFHHKGTMISNPDGGFVLDLAATDAIQRLPHHEIQDIYFELNKITAKHQIELNDKSSDGATSIWHIASQIDHLRANALSGGFSSDLVNPLINRVFQAYRDTRFRHEWQSVRDAQDGTAEGLVGNAFIERFGIPPWERLDEAFKAFSFPYRTEPPSSHPAGDVGFYLIAIGSTARIPFHALSSGEKVLLRLILSTFQADDDRINVVLPKVMLFDEMDASLHPANTQRWLFAIKDGLVDRLGVCCILTTHSPTTVALAPEGSIFEMTPAARHPRAVTKQHAIDQLTAGLPMLSIDYSARRQVFVESTIDVEHYERLFDIMRTTLDVPRTLSFLGTSTKGGCTFVYEMVKHMQTHGNRAVFGIVDWDLENNPTTRVRVLADGSHYSKDNVLLDPLLIGALMLKNDELPLDPPVTYAALASASTATLQRVSDAVVAAVRFPHTASTAIAVNSYAGGLSLNVRKGYQTYNGHELEDRLKEAWFPLQRYRDEGKLITELIRRVVFELPALCPAPIVNIMRALATDPADR